MGPEVFKLSGTGSRHRYPTRPDLNREVFTRTANSSDNFRERLLDKHIGNSWSHISRGQAKQKHRLVDHCTPFFQYLFKPCEAFLPHLALTNGPDGPLSLEEPPPRLRTGTEPSAIFRIGSISAWYANATLVRAISAPVICGLFSHRGTIGFRTRRYHCCRRSCAREDRLTERTACLVRRVSQYTVGDRV